MPEFRDYLNMYWRQRLMIAIVVVVATIATWVTASAQPVRYAASESFAINRINRQNTTAYQYDDYYALQAADLFAQTVVSWFSTPSILQEAYVKANLDPMIDSVNSLPSRFKVRKYTAQNIVVRFTETTQDRADKLATSIRQVIEARSATLNQNPDGKSIFEIIGADAVVARSRPNALLLSAAALVLSLGAGLLLAALRHYLRAE